MPATGTNPKQQNSKSIRLTADGFSFYDGREVVLVVGRSTWMPLREFNASAVDNIYNKVYAPAERPSVVRYNILPTLEVVELWSVGRDTYEQLRADHPYHRWMGADGVVLETVVHYDALCSSANRLYAYLHDGEMFVFSYRDRSLFYANSFWPRSDEEARYFLLAAWRRLAFDAEKDECLLLGDHEALLPLLAPYLRHVGSLTNDMLRLPASDLPIDLLCV